MTNTINFNKLSSKYHVTKTKIVKEFVLSNGSTTKFGDFSAGLANFREEKRIDPSLNLQNLKKAQPL